MLINDKSYRFRLPTSLFEEAMTKAEAQDMVLAQVLRRMMTAWVCDELELRTLVRITAPGDGAPEGTDMTKREP